MAGGSIWERFTLDPRVEQHAHMRAADRDRDVINDVLGAAYAEGRLTPEELDERADQAARARTLGELPEIVGDLVAMTPARVAPGNLRAEAERRYRMHRQQALVAWLVPTLICWVVWSATMFGGFPWPAIVTVATSVRLLQLLLTREETTSSIEHRLEKKERKRLEARRRKELGAAPPDQTT